MTDITGKQFIFNGETIAVEAFESPNHQPPAHKAIYEVIRVEKGVPLFIEDYLDRLSNSFRLNKITCNWNDNTIYNTVNRLIQINDHSSGPIKLVFGCDNPTYLLAYLMKPHLPKPEEYITGVKTILMKETRQNPNAKVWNHELRERSVKQLKETNAYEAILVNHEGYITEASRSNVFFIKSNTVYTCPDELILPGITRKKVLEIIKQADIAIAFKAFRPEDLDFFDSCFLTGTARKIVPVKWINDRLFGVNNPLFNLIVQQFEKFVEDYINQRK